MTPKSPTPRILIATLVLALGLGTLGVGVRAQIGSAPSQLPDMALAGFDFTGNVTTSDRVVYYANGGTGGVHGSVEIPIDAPRVPGVAYIRGNGGSIAITARNTHPGQRVAGEVEILAARLVAPPHSDGTPGEIYPIPISGGGPHTLNVPANDGRQSFTIGISGLPNHVSLGDFQLKYRMPVSWPDDPTATPGENGTLGNFQTITRMYVVDAQPTGAQAAPWTDFLEFACRWGFGAAGADLQQKTTYGMHYSNRCPDNKVIYAYTSENYTRYFVGSSNVAVYLNKFVNDISSQPLTYGDCNDFAAILGCALQALGRSAQTETQRPLDANGQILGGFYTTEMCPAGYDSTIYNGLGSGTDTYNQFGFSNHVLCLTDATYHDSSSSYAYSPAGAVLQNPVTGGAMPTYWQNPISSYGYGLCYGDSPYPSTTQPMGRWTELHPISLAPTPDL